MSSSYSKTNIQTIQEIYKQYTSEGICLELLQHSVTLEFCHNFSENIAAEGISSIIAQHRKNTDTILQHNHINQGSTYAANRLMSLHLIQPGLDSLYLRTADEFSR